MIGRQYALFPPADEVLDVVEHKKLCRWRLDDGEPLPFPVLEEHRSAGYVDYAIAPMIFSDGKVNAVSWADGPGRRLQRGGSPAVRRSTPDLFDGRGS